jgi:aminoglycoside phosphotransferase (APT) family kinase protein
MSRPEPEPAPRTIEPEPARLRDRLTSAARAVWPGARIGSLRRLAGGASSLTYLAELVGAPEPAVIVKVAPAGLAVTRHRDVLRQALVLEVLAGADGVPVPRLWFADPGGGADGPFFAMSVSPGDAGEPNIDDHPPAGTAADLGARVRHAAGILAALHTLDTAPVALGEEALGEEVPVSLAGEIERWDRAFATLPRSFRLDWEASSELLRATMPEPEPPRLTHGDYRLGNLLCAGSRVSAVIDWEIWSLGDRRTDLGWFLLSLDAALHPAAVRAADGIPGRMEVLDSYLGAAGEPAGHVGWFIALALYKFAATTGLIGKHALKRADTDSWGARMIPRLPRALQRIPELATAS